MTSEGSDNVVAVFGCW